MATGEVGGIGKADAGRVTGRRDRWLTAYEAEVYLGIPRATVRSWARRHKSTGLFAIDKDRRGVDLYVESDLLKIRRGEKIRRPGVGRVMS